MARPQGVLIAHGDFIVIIRDIAAIDRIHVRAFEHAIDVYSPPPARSDLDTTSIGGTLPSTWSAMHSLNTLCVINL